MAQTETQLKIEIKAYIDKKGGAYRTWYVGTTNNPERRLFDEHGVDKHNGLYIYRTATSADVARRVEQYFIRLGVDGGPGGGDYQSKVVYAYKKTTQTTP